MPENNNNNNDNLFTQMFGLESEQPQTLPPKTEPPKVENTQPEPVTTPVTEQRVISAQTNTETNQVFQQSLASELNQKVAQPIQEESNNVVTLAPTKKEEIIELTDTPITQEEPQEVTTEPKFDPNALPTEPYDYVPSPTYPGEENIGIPSSNGIGVKIFLVLILVIALVCGWLYYYNTVLDPVEETPSQEVNNEIEEETDEPEEEVEETPKINFTQSLTFYKGLVSDENELNQEFPYEPAATTGVVRCEFIEPMKDSGITINIHAYLYYEDYKLKKTYLQQITNFEDKSTFNQNVTAIEELVNSYNNTEVLTIDSQIDKTTQTIKFGMFSNLAYGSYTNSSQEGMIAKLKFNYDDSIKKAMSTMYGLEGMIGNIKCSSVKTS